MPIYKHTLTKAKPAASAIAFSGIYHHGALPVSLHNKGPGFVQHGLRQNSFPVVSGNARARTLERRGIERAQDASLLRLPVLTLPPGMSQNELESTLSAWANDIVGRISKFNGGCPMQCAVHRDKIRSE